MVCDDYLDCFDGQIIAEETSPQLYVDDYLSTISNEETSLQDFLEIKKILKKCLLVTSIG